VTRLFLDTAPVIYYVEQNPDYTLLVDQVFLAIDEGSLEGVASSITLAEALVRPIRLGLVDLQQAFHHIIVQSERTTFVTVGAEEARQAALIRATYNLSLTDSIQIACALATGCEAFLTNDAALRRVTEIRTVLVTDLR
jgi:predicted nucleic acid-binding protein